MQARAPSTSLRLGLLLQGRGHEGRQPGWGWRARTFATSQAGVASPRGQFLPPRRWPGISLTRRRSLTAVEFRTSATPAARHPYPQLLPPAPLSLAPGRKGANSPFWSKYPLQQLPEGPSPPALAALAACRHRSAATAPTYRSRASSGSNIAARSAVPPSPGCKRAHLPLSGFFPVQILPATPPAEPLPPAPVASTASSGSL